ncbi:MAG TPA: hypothetical protein VM582_02945 [Candidatus Thermoplasmatota archaeon]|nr:hypothetical protein [Candidatus Thermoplasmatota archaeon]
MANIKIGVGIAVGVFLLLAFAVLMFAAGFGVGAPEAGIIFGVFGLMIVNFALIIAAIVHALVRDDLTGVQRIIWIAIAFFVTPIVALGAIVYFALGKQRTHDLFRDVGVTRSPPPASPPGP